MLFQLFLREFQRHKIINATLFLFILTSAMLLSSAAYVGFVLNQGIQELTTKGQTPDYIQMHAGTVDEEALAEFADSIDYLRGYQLQEMITIDPNTIYIKDDATTEVNGVMDISFVTQNKDFDYLLTLDNEVASVEDGFIGVPVYYQVKYDLEVGDTIVIRIGNEVYPYTISTFTRDSQMNSSLISSKRFLISDDDFQHLAQAITAREYMIAYRFDSLDRTASFKQAYQDAGLPDSGPAVGLRLFRLMNAITDGIVILILLLVSAALTTIGLLCLRFTLLSNIEEDIKEIGVMKAIGMSSGNIRTLYFSKFLFLSLFAVSGGYLASFLLQAIFLGNIQQYMGKVTVDGWLRWSGLMGAIIVLSTILLTVHRLLKRTDRISVVQTLTDQGHVVQMATGKPYSPVRHQRTPLPVALGINRVRSSKKQYRLMVVIIAVATAMMILPNLVHQTMSDRGFIEYMGIGDSDLRLDIRAEDGSIDIDELMRYLDEDEDIASYAVFRTYTMNAYNTDDEIENLFVELGDFDTFPLRYLEGRAPRLDNEIALSSLSMQALDKEVGDRVRVIRGTDVIWYDVVGEYQDITNGGKTAKATSKAFEQELLWHVIGVDVESGVDANTVAQRYSSEFASVKATSIDAYLDQTLGETIDQLHGVSLVSMAIAILVTGLITALFLNMILIKDRREIAIQKSIGMSEGHITIQYLSRMMLVLLIGLIGGLLFVQILGDDLVSIFSRAFGASRMVLKQNLWFTYLFVPVGLVACSGITSYLVIRSNRIDNIYQHLIG